MWNIPTPYRTLVKEEVKILGVMLLTDKQNMQQNNYSPILDKRKKMTTIWAKRRISLADEIALIKTLIISQLVYCMMVLPTGILERGQQNI